MNYIKSDKLQNFLFVFGGILCIVFHYKFIIIPPVYELFFIIIIAIIVFLYNKILRLKIGEIIIEEILICYIIAGIVLFCRSYYLPDKVYIVHLEGYSRSNIDKIFFKFNGYSFQKYYTLTDYTDLDSYDKYEIKLYLKEPYPNVFYVSGIMLYEK